MPERNQYYSCHIGTTPATSVLLPPHPQEYQVLPWAKHSHLRSARVSRTTPCGFYSFFFFVAGSYNCGSTPMYLFNTLCFASPFALSWRGVLSCVRFCCRWLIGSFESVPRIGFAENPGLTHIVWKAQLPVPCFFARFFVSAQFIARFFTSARFVALLFLSTRLVAQFFVSTRFVARFFASNRFVARFFAST